VLTLKGRAWLFLSLAGEGGPADVCCSSRVALSLLAKVKSVTSPDPHTQLKGPENHYWALNLFGAISV